jgi:predicted AlkP superfamily pyrophosphatase or phosphodiesterase
MGRSSRCVDEMNQRTRTFIGRGAACWILLVALRGVLLCGAVTASDRHVVLVTIDGFPASMFWDAKTSIPQIRQLAGDGVAAEAMRVSTPTVTWPNHTTLVTGVRPQRHSVLFNGILRRAGPGLSVNIDPKNDKSELVAGPTIFDLLHEHGFRTAAIDWPCTRNSTALDDDFPDTPDSLLHTTSRLRRELVAQNILADESDAAFHALTGPGRDDVWTKAACYVIRQRKPNLLVLHLLTHSLSPPAVASNGPARSLRLTMSMLLPPSRTCWAKTSPEPKEK